MSKIAYMPTVVKGRYVHFSYSGKSCAIGDFIANDAMAIRDYKTSEAEDLIVHWIPADTVPYTDVNFWIKRLTDYSRQKLGSRAIIPERSYSMPHVKDSDSKPLTGSTVIKIEPSGFSRQKPKIVFYGERGIVNSLFF